MDEKLALIRAHPDLVGRAMLTAESQGEQTAAGLDRSFGRRGRAVSELQPRLPGALRISLRDLRAAEQKGSDPARHFPSACSTRVRRKWRPRSREIYKIADLRLRDLIAMSALSTHVLDTMRGRPAAGMKIEFRSVDRQRCSKRS